jgi:hypothetical protein
VTLAWYRASSADDEHDDQEVDLAKIGSPGGASWAYVALEGPEWTWGVLDQWMWDDSNESGKPVEYLASGAEHSQSEAKNAVEQWVESHRG